MLDLWYKNAVIYCVDVETFMDADASGSGDFRGLANRLDHLEELGATCIWLLPFYPGPNRDDGYDVSDYYAVDPRFGSLGDFVSFAHAARDRGVRVIVDLVVNHTSVDHPWFQQARRDPNSPYRDWYVWSKEKPKSEQGAAVFPGKQENIWSYDEVAGEWYFHRFFDHQADLNIANPAVKDEINQILGFWLQMGVSGFRIDAVPFLIEYKGLDEEDKPEQDPHAYLTAMRSFVSWRKAEAVLLGEANIPFEAAQYYFGRGDRLHLIFNFPLNQNLFLALARGDAAPIRRVLENMPAIPSTAQWANFLRNHDELDLARLSDEERQEVFDAFAPAPSMRIFGRGIRRRLAPMLGDDRRIKLAYSLMFALPGTPVLWYGDEIGMGDDLSLEGRHAVRTPMQWSDEPNAGFSEAAPDRLARPVVSGGAYGYETVNIAAQREESGSLMQHLQRLIRTRRACPEVGWGEWRVIETSDAGVLALRYEWRGQVVLAMHNLSGRDACAKLSLDSGPVRLKPLLSSADDRLPKHTTEVIPIEPFGFRWFRAFGERR